MASDERALEVLDPREVAQLAAHEATPLIGADYLAPQPELFPERHCLLRPLEAMHWATPRSCSRVTPSSVRLDELRPGGKQLEELQ